MASYRTAAIFDIHDVDLALYLQPTMNFFCDHTEWKNLIEQHKCKSLYEINPNVLLFEIGERDKNTPVDPNNPLEVMMSEITPTYTIRDKRKLSEFLSALLIRDDVFDDVVTGFCDGSLKHTNPTSTNEATISWAAVFPGPGGMYLGNNKTGKAVSYEGVASSTLSEIYGAFELLRMHYINDPNKPLRAVCDNLNVVRLMSTNLSGIEGSENSLATPAALVLKKALKGMNVCAVWVHSHQATQIYNSKDMEFLVHGNVAADKMAAAARLNMITGVPEGMPPLNREKQMQRSREKSSVRIRKSRIGEPAIFLSR